MRYFLYTAALSVLFCTTLARGVYAQDPVINEFMSRNDTTLPDRDGDFPDWIELYNPGDQELNLQYYSLSDNPTEARKWVFPEVTIAPYGYLVIFASGKERPYPSELHTNFKISGGGETLILSNQGGAVIDLVDSVSLVEDQSMGRIPDGGRQWLKSSLPTPGSSNEVNNQLLFSHKQGFYELPFYLEISSLNGDTVHYTLDGSTPESHSELNLRPIYLENRTSEANRISEVPTSPGPWAIDYKAWESPGMKVHKAWVIRSASFRNGIRTSPVSTRTYIIDNQIAVKFQMPVISLVTDSLNLFDSDSGIYLPGDFFDSSNPTWSGNYFQKGREWERSVHLEYFSSDGSLELFQDAGFRIHGGGTRAASQKTIRLYAREQYGPDRFNFRLLPQKEVNEYKHFLLRTSMGSWNGEEIITDVLAHELVRELDVEMLDYQPVVVYLNGEYWGIHTLRDRVDEWYIEYLTGIDKDSIDLINGNIALVEAGSNDHYQRLAEFIKRNKLDDPGHYEYVCSQIDISSFVDYLIAEMFFSNDDWPGNNQMLWRPQTPEGRWRWIFFDLDAAFRNTEMDMFERAMMKEGELEWRREPVSSFLFRNLLHNAEFQSYFFERFAEVLNEEFTQKKIYDKLTAIKEIYQPEIENHMKRWHYPSSVGKWESDIREYLLDFLISRPCIVAHQVREYFDRPDFGFRCLTREEFSHSLRLAPNPTNGSFYLRNMASQSVIGQALITDVTGKLIYFEEDISLDYLEEKYFDLTWLSAGIYFVKIINAELSAVKPIIIQ